MASVLVSGGAGFIGSHLAEALVKAGHEVTIIDDLYSGRMENIAAIKDQVTFIRASITDSKALDEACDGKDFVFHLAAISNVGFSVSNPLDTHTVNATGTLKVLLAAKKAGVKRVVFSSSASVYGDDPSLPKTESSAVIPLSPYALSKLYGEQSALLFYKLYKFETVALRYFNVYGPRQDPKSPYSGVITKFITALKSGKRVVIFGDGRQTRDFVFVSDVVQANICAMSADVAGSVFNIATGKQTSIKDLHNTVAELLEVDSSPDHKPKQPGDIVHSVADISRAKKLLNFSPSVGLREGLEITIKES